MRFLVQDRSKSGLRYQDLRGGKLQRLLLVDAYFDFDLIFLVEIARRFMPNDELVRTGWQFRNFELSFSICDSGIGVINDHQISIHPDMEIAGDLSRKLFGQLERF